MNLTSIALLLIAAPLWALVALIIFALTDKRGALRMVDIDRAKVYSTHLGGKLKDNEPGAGERT